RAVRVADVPATVDEQHADEGRPLAPRPTATDPKLDSIGEAKYEVDGPNERIERAKGPVPDSEENAPGRRTGARWRLAHGRRPGRSPRGVYRPNAALLMSTVRGSSEASSSSGS